MNKYIVLFAILILGISCQDTSTQNHEFDNMTQDEIFIQRLQNGAESYIKALKAIEYHKNIHADESIYQRIAENFSENGSLTLSFMGTSGIDSENDGVYRDMFLNLQRAVSNIFTFENYRESDSFFDAEGKLLAQYEIGKDIWEAAVVNASRKQIKTISFELNGTLYTKEFQQYTDMTDYQAVIEELLNGALEKEGYEERWYQIPSVDQTNNMIFTTQPFWEELKKKGYIGTQQYYNSLPF